MKLCYKYINQQPYLEITYLVMIINHFTKKKSFIFLLNKIKQYYINNQKCQPIFY